MQIIAQLKTFNADTTPLEDLVTLSFVARGLRAEYDARGVAVPEWLDDAIRRVTNAISNQTRDAKVARLRELAAAEDKLIPASERREKIAAERQALEKELAGVK